MSEDQDYSSLPLTERAVHKVWKVRLGAYEEMIQLFEKSSSENDECFQVFISNFEIFKKIVTDANVVAQETGLIALVKFLKYGNTDRIISKLRVSVIGPMCEKSLASSRAGTRQNAVDALMWFIELDTADPVIEQLIPYLSHKMPKLISGCTMALTEIIKNYGCKTCSPKPILPLIPKLFGHADKLVRQEATNLSIEIYKWMGQFFENCIFPDLKPVQQKDLTLIFEKIKDEKPQQIRFLRSQQREAEAEAAAAAAAASATTTGENNGNEGDVEMNDADKFINGKDDANMAIDAYDMIGPVDVLSKLPSNINDRINSTKWKDRKELLEEIQKDLNVMKMSPDGDYTDLLRMLAKCVLKDANIQCVQLAANSIEFTAKGLRNKFERYVQIVISSLLERMKEKKLSVVEALGNALDAAFNSSSFTAIVEEIAFAMKHKTPNVKIETCKFLTRCLKNTKFIPSSSEVELIMNNGIKLLADSQEPVRIAASEAIGTLMKLTGERELNTYMDKVEEHRRSKVNEFFEKAEVIGKPQQQSQQKMTARPRKPAIANGTTSRPAAASSSRPTANSDSNVFQASSRPSMLKKKLTAPKMQQPSLYPPSSTVPSKRGATSPLKRQDEHSTQAQISTRNINGSRQTNSLTGRSLASSTSSVLSQHQMPPAPRFENPLSAAEKSELEALRAEKQLWLKEKEQYRWTQSDVETTKQRLMQEINSLQMRNDALMEEHTKDNITIKSRNTQLNRLQSDLESARQRILHLEKEIEGLTNIKRESSINTFQSTRYTNYLSESKQLQQHSYSERAPFSPTQSRYLSSTTVSGARSPYAENANKNISSELSSGVKRLSIENKADKENAFALPQLDYKTGQTTIIDSDSSKNNSSSGFGTALGLDTDDESWRRASEVTSQLKARIEKMKARSRSNVSNFKP
ncbi:hypothetical protein PACTADRAFT_31888 [Pachysolen tannophilus NRRL Y-2460]|uniref:TOG domain-containing protein n=1 Tax=Pachysolen tannophilus NRRL Y-2460 TaxID=669874 RepID=A0A1E4U3C7_PACTA|nr:hypothetical protein PACTADRAFT_31888 [Pachysolen tannophilus NRRL Y-2460]